MSSEKKEKKVVALNKRARFDYYIGETIEAGLVLQGSEVKSLRQGQGSITESYATESFSLLIHLFLNIMRLAALIITQSVVGSFW